MKDFIRFAGLSGLLILGAGSAPTLAQTGFTPSPRDSGWVPLFNGKNLEGLFPHVEEGQWGENRLNLVTVHDSTIHFYQGRKRANRDAAPNGVLSTGVEFSHYRCRVEFRHGEVADDGWLAGDPYNSGFFFHAKPGGPAWPPAIECQLKRHWNSNGNKPCSAAAKDCNQLWAGDYWLLNTVQIEKDGVKSQTGGSCCYPTYGSHSPDRELEGWNKMEIEVYGDSLFRNILNGFEVNHGSHSTWMNQGQRQPLTKGRIQLELEGSEIRFRNWEVKLFKKDSLYATWYKEGCRDPAYVEYAPAANLHVGTLCVTPKASAVMRAGAGPGNRPTDGTRIPRWRDPTGTHDAGGRKVP